MGRSMEISMVAMTLRSREPSRLGTFYSETLGLKTMRNDSSYTVIDCGGVSLELKSSGSGGGQELRFETEDVDGDVAELTRRGVKFVEMEIGIKEDGSTAMGIVGETFWGRYAKLVDPEGNSITLEEHDEERYPFMPLWYRKGMSGERRTNG